MGEVMGGAVDCIDTDSEEEGGDIFPIDNMVYRNYSTIL